MSRKNGSRALRLPQVPEGAGTTALELRNRGLAERFLWRNAPRYLKELEKIALIDSDERSALGNKVQALKYLLDLTFGKDGLQAQAGADLKDVLKETFAQVSPQTLEKIHEIVKDDLREQGKIQDVEVVKKDEEE